MGGQAEWHKPSHHACQSSYSLMLLCTRSQIVKYFLLSVTQSRCHRLGLLLNVLGFSLCHLPQAL